MTLVAQLESRQQITAQEAIGVSGSCRREDRRYYVTERNHKLIGIDNSDLIEVVALEGVPQGLDLEGLACDSEKFYISTESAKPDRSVEIVLVVAIEDEVARVVDTLELAYPDPIVGSPNWGVEGLCVADGWLIAAVEYFRTDSNQAATRMAPILRQKLGSTDTFVTWLKLTSETGKISALDCRQQNDLIEVFAIEQHFGVARVLQFDLQESPATPQTIVTLEHLIRSTENFESILVSDEGKVLLANDNQHKAITGASEETSLVPLIELAVY